MLFLKYKLRLTFQRMKNAEIWDIFQILEKQNEDENGHLQELQHATAYCPGKELNTDPPHISNNSWQTSTPKRYASSSSDVDKLDIIHFRAHLPWMGSSDKSQTRQNHFSLLESQIYHKLWIWCTYLSSASVDTDLALRTIDSRCL